MLEDAQGTLILTKSEVAVLSFYLDKAVIDAEGDYVIGIGDKVKVDRLHSIRNKVAVMRKERWDEG